MRHHVVLIPGFGGFDVLGQIQYYTGITSFVDRWQNDPSGDNLDLRRTVELHYFDNLPTAAVVTRADRLKNYLAKRIARGSFQSCDKLILIGHSTGGLDIRKLLQDLRLHPDEPIPVDNDANAVMASEILHVMSRIVFLSVPQYGTNIANWTISHNLERRIGIILISGFASTVLQVIPGKIIDVLGGFLLAQNLREAIRDAVRESSVILAGNDSDCGSRTSTRTFWRYRISATPTTCPFPTWMRTMIVMIRMTLSAPPITHQKPVVAKPLFGETKGSRQCHSPPSVRMLTPTMPVHQETPGTPSVFGVLISRASEAVILHTRRRGLHAQAVGSTRTPRPTDR
jgi:hypothetical protein